MANEIRTFIAVKLSRDLIRQIGKLQDELRSASKEKIKWVEPENIHLTLKFLGEIPKEKLEGIFEVTERVCKNHSSFQLSLEGLGVFPDYRRPRVVWLGIALGKEELKKMALELDNELSKLGFPKEDREFKAHLTLARLKFKPEHLMEVLKTKQFASQPILIDEVHVIKSDLRPQGPIYTTLKSVKL